MPRIQGSHVGLSGLLLVAAGALPATAGTVSLNGSGQMAWTAQFLGSATGNVQSTPSASVTPATGNNYALSLPGQYTFLDQFTSPQSSPLTGVATSPVGNGSYSFEDVYEFSLNAPASGDVLTTSLYLQPNSQGPSIFNIDNLQFQLFEVTSPTPTPGLGIPGGSHVVQSWTGIGGNDNGQTISASFSNVLSGTYFLQVAGIADGTAGGTYIGQLNVAPVPVPASLPLLISGVVGLGLASRRRRPTS